MIVHIAKTATATSGPDERMEKNEWRAIRCTAATGSNTPFQNQLSQHRHER